MNQMIIMKKYIVMGFLLMAMSLTAQVDSGLGITAGLNYGSTGDLRENGQDIIDNPDEKIGYHVGVYWKIDLPFLYLRPELKYTQLSNEYRGDQFDLQKIDMPLLIGTNIAGPLHVFAGPSLQYIVDTKLEGTSLSDVQNEWSVGAQFGVGVNLGNLGIDVRYERGFTDNEVDFIRNNIAAQGTLDTRPEQIILAISLNL
jgi:hypothetical protein